MDATASPSPATVAIPVNGNGPGLTVPTAAAVNPLAYAEYAAIPIVLGFAILLCLGIMGAVRFITRVLNRIASSPERNTTYECGEAPVGRAWFRFNNRFYRIALVFLVCDCQFALLLPVLPRLRHHVAMGLGAAALAALVVVAVCVALGIAHAARNRDLLWNKAVEGARHD